MSAGPPAEGTEDNLNAGRTALRRVSRRVGFFYLGLSPVAAAFGAWASSTVTYGVVLGALFFALGLYTAFLYAPFAAWIRRWERSRGL